MLKLTNITKDYKVASSMVHALKGVSLEFRKSEFVCVLGQSGCGKTTLLNIIGGLDHYTTGDLVIQGKSTKDFKDRDWDVYRNHRIGFIFQSYNLIPHQTVLGNVELALTIAGVGKEERKRRAKEALERVGLGDELHKRPNQLSGGQMQRVAIARALVNNPDILLADEPTGALDSKTSVEVMELIKEIAGERLVIMVTHNPELAEQYATRIVRLHDGLVESDSNPYHEEAVETHEQPVKKDKKARVKMGFLTSLALSARNLLTKKGRTIITSVAGSIGIISVCLVLALSSGFNNYIRRTEEDMLSYYPIEISERTIDLTAVMSNATSASNMPDLSEIGDKVYVNSFLTSLAQGIAVTNNISEDYIAYLNKGKEDHPGWISEIQYSYGASINDNLFTSVVTGGVKDRKTGEILPEQTRNLSLSALKDFYSNDLISLAPEYEYLLPYVNFFGDILDVMPGTADFSDKNYAEYVLSQYDILDPDTMHFPENEGEAVLVVGGNNESTDLTLAQLGFLPERDFMSLFNMGEEGHEKEGDYLTIPFEDILAKEYVLYYNDAVYEQNTSPMSAYPFTYSGERDTLSAKDGENELGIPLKITAVLRLKQGRTYGCIANGIGITEATVQKYIAANKQSKIVKWMTSGEEFSMQNPNGVKIKIDPEAVPAEFKKYVPQDGYVYRSPAQHLNDSYIGFDMGQMTLFITPMQDTVIRAIGGNDAPSGIKIYPSDFDAKDNVLEYLDAWNNMEGRAEEDKITYTDTVGLLMGMVQTMLNVITYVLVAFTSISLVVSSVMIGIITYVSVVERVKEIGVLRSIGASKQDIRNLFNAETFIIGLAAGLIGIGVTYLLSLLVNLIIYSLSGISGIAALPPLTAGIMVIVSVLLTLISGLIPAQAAAKKDPVIALRTE